MKVRVEREIDGQGYSWMVDPDAVRVTRSGDGATIVLPTLGDAPARIIIHLTDSKAAVTLLGAVSDAYDVVHGRTARVR